MPRCVEAIAINLLDRRIFTCSVQSCFLGKCLVSSGLRPKTANYEYLRIHQRFTGKESPLLCMAGIGTGCALHSTPTPCQPHVATLCPTLFTSNLGKREKISTCLIAHALPQPANKKVCFNLLVYLGLLMYSFLWYSTSRVRVWSWLNVVLCRRFRASFRCRRATKCTVTF